MNYPITTLSLTCGTRVSVGPACHRHRTGETARDGAAMVELADGGSSGEIDSTYTIYVTSRVEWCYRRDLRPSGGGSSPVMAARQHSSARHRQQQAMTNLTELGMSYRGSLRCYPSKNRGTRSLGGSWPRRAPTPARLHHGGRWRKRPMCPYQDPIGAAKGWRR